jgi:hypothetical protein
VAVAGDIPFNTHHRSPDILKTKSAFYRLGEGRYQLSYPDIGIVLDASQVHRGRDRELVGELTVTTTLRGARTFNGVLSAASMNFSSQRTRTERAKHLMERSGAPDLDWSGAVERLCYEVMLAEQQGEPIKPLADYDEPQAETEWTIGGIPILQQHPMILFGDGGNAKSYLALWIAATLATRGIRVLYADWEFSPEEHRKRLRLLSNGVLPRDLHYVRCSNPLVTESARLSAYIAKEKMQFIVCDSIAFAVPGRPEDAEHAGAYFRAVRSFGVGSLHLAHVTKASPDAPDPDKPFGSVFWNNGARSTWLIKRANEGAEEANTLEVALYHKKTNTGKRLGARGLRLSFGESNTRVEPFDVLDNDELAAKLPVWQRMQKALKHGPLSVQELAERLDAPEDTIRKTAKRLDMFIKRPDGELALADRRDDGGF